MEIIRNYPELDEILKSIKKIADNLEEMTNIMQIRNTGTTTPEKFIKNSMYGIMAARPLPDYDPEILRSEIQDLKLENDRLKRRNELMEDYIHAVACLTSEKTKFYGLCDKVSYPCPYYDYHKSFGDGACTLGSRESIEKEAADLIDKLEDL